MDLGNFAQARAWLEESLQLQLPLGAPGHITTLRYLSNLELNQGNFVDTRAYINEILLMSKNAGMIMTWQYLFSLADLGYIALREGDIVLAKETFRLSVKQFLKANRFIDGVTYTIEGLASLYVNQGQFERAAQLLAWADAMREKIKDHRPAIEQKSVERDLEVIHSQLNDSEFAKVSADGQRLTMEEAVALALQETHE